MCFELGPEVLLCFVILLQAHFGARLSSRSYSFRMGMPNFDKSEAYGDRSFMSPTSSNHASDWVLH